MSAGEQPDQHASSTGQPLTTVAWTDARFESNRPEYVAQVRAVGIQPGWRVLDAGCAGGAFLPYLAELVGPDGRLEAFDLAPENIAAVVERVAAHPLIAPIEARVGTIVALPYPDNAFDAVWCANTTTYLDDEALLSALTEFHRVVRPGGLVAVKDVDAALLRVLPAPPGLLLRSYEVRNYSSLRTAVLPGWLRRTGLTVIRRHTTLIERSAPFTPLYRQLWEQYLVRTAHEVAGYALPAADMAYWATVRDPAGLAQILDDPDLYFCEGNTLAVGQVPE